MGQEPRQPWLCEIKYRHDFHGQWRSVLPKFRAAALPIIWFLVAERYVGAKLHEPLTMYTPIWHLEGMRKPL